MLAVVAVIAVLLIAAELLARALLPGIVRQSVISSVGLPADQQMQVDASGVLLPQLIGGRLDRLRLTSDSVTLGGVTGSADVTAEGVPLRGGDLGSATGTISIDQKQFGALVAKADLPIEDVTLKAPNVTVGGSVPLFGASLPLALTVTPGADAGELLLTPVSVSLAGKEIDLGQLADRLGPLASMLAETQRICIADRLPAGLTLTGLRIVGDRAVADVSVDGRIATDPKLQENGVCPPV